VAKKLLPLDKIIQSKRLKVRAGGLNKEHVADLAAAYKAGADIPPPRVFEIKGLAGYYLTRGRHRLAALEEISQAKVECEVRAGDHDDALRDAAQGDGEHGLRRTNKDKRETVLRYLAEHADWSDRKIAEEAGVSNEMVGDVRVSDSDTGGKKPKETQSVLKSVRKSFTKLAREEFTAQTAQQWLEDVIAAAKLLVETFKKDGGLF